MTSSTDALDDHFDAFSSSSSSSLPARSSTVSSLLCSRTTASSCTKLFRKDQSFPRALSLWRRLSASRSTAPSITNPTLLLESFEALRPGEKLPLDTTTLDSSLDCVRTGNGRPLAPGAKMFRWLRSFPFSTFDRGDFGGETDHTSPPFFAHLNRCARAPLPLLAPFGYPAAAPHSLLACRLDV